MQSNYAVERARATLTDAALLEWIAANGPVRLNKIAVAFGIEVFDIQGYRTEQAKRLAQQLQRLRKISDTGRQRPALRANGGQQWYVEAEPV